LHPFFDNLVAEGWLQDAQSRALGIDRNNRLELLLAFGADCAGAVFVIDIERSPVRIDPDVPEIAAAVLSKASLSGVQPKLFVTKEQGGFRPARPGELSTFIAKLPSQTLPNLIELEWLTTKATKALLVRNPVVELEIGEIPGVADTALMIKRFDRNEEERLHFEEFNTLLHKRQEEKYDGGYEQMGRFIQSTSTCIPAEAERLYRRILACFLFGNTDAHLKNFAMMHQEGGLRLSPSYDLVASAIYKQYNTLALSVNGAENLRISDLMPKHLVGLASGFGLSEEVVMLAVEDFEKRRQAVTKAIEDDQISSAPLKSDFLELMEKRWNGTFGLVGTMLSKKREKGEKLKGFRKRD
jgi:serine/threonine-protein kinase HipA